MRKLALAMCVSFGGLALVAGPLSMVAEAGVFNKAKKKAKKVGKSGKKLSKKARDKARKGLSAAQKRAIAVGGEVTGTLTTAIQYTTAEVASVARDVGQTFTRLARALENWFNNQFIGAFRGLYNDYISDYANLAMGLQDYSKARHAGLGKLGVEIIDGNYDVAMAIASQELRGALGHQVEIGNQNRKTLVRLAKAMGFGTVFVFADGSLSASGFTGGGGAGLAMDIDRFDPEYRGRSHSASKIFVTGGAGVTSDTAGAGIGVYIGFIRGTPSAVKGEDIEARGSVRCDKTGRVQCTVGLAWPINFSRAPSLPLRKRDFVPETFMFGVGAAGAVPVRSRSARPMGER